MHDDSILIQVRNRSWMYERKVETMMTVRILAHELRDCNCSHLRWGRLWAVPIGIHLEMATKWLIGDVHRQLIRERNIRERNVGWDIHLEINTYMGGVELSHSTGWHLTKQWVYKEIRKEELMLTSANYGIKKVGQRENFH